jgi:hypothetical protein
MSGEVKAVLEAHELVLRGEIKRRFPLADISDLCTIGDELRFKNSAGEFTLELGANRARRWAEKIATPPPSLAKKLGVAPTSKIMLIGPIDDIALQEALKDGIAVQKEEPRSSLAVVRDEPTLIRALGVHESLAAGTPIWIVHQKGQKASFGEGPVRSFMRGAGYRDNKVSAVSDTLSATRYTRGEHGGNASRNDLGGRRYGGLGPREPR